MLSSSNSTVLKKRLDIIIYIPEIFDKQVIIRDVVTVNVFERGSNLFILTR